MRSLMAMMVTAAYVVAAPMAQAETLGDALIAAYKNSNLLDQNRALLKAADEDVAIAVGTLQPIVNFAIESTWQNQERTNFFGVRGSTDSLSTTFTLSAEMTLIDFGRNRLAIEVAKESVLATRESLLNIEQDVLLDAVTAYVNVRLATEIVDLRQSNLRLITQELRAAQDRFEVGEITRTDVSLAEARLAEATCWWHGKAIRRQLEPIRGTCNLCRPRQRQRARRKRPPKSPCAPIRAFAKASVRWRLRG
jgi:outer membrane protein